MKIEVRLFASLTCKNESLPCYGEKEFHVDVPEGTTVKGLHSFLKLQPGPVVTVVNGIVETKDVAIPPGARVGIFPPVAGG